jgi:peptidoglycan/xylan/chitin deacetylase (PgdA/CDA1 family)
MAVLARLARPMELEAMLAAASTGRLPRGTVAVTFDDGYADALHVARPILHDCSVPATLFVTSGHMATTFWWDELEEMILGAPTLPAELDLELGDGAIQWRLNGQAPAVARQELLLRLYRLFRQWPDEHERGLRLLRQWTGHDGAKPSMTLSRSELATLATDELFTIGAHGLSHRALTRMPKAEAAREVEQSKSALEEMTGRPVRAFSYPHGVSGGSTRSLLISAGYSLACASQNGVVSRSSDPYFLPRFWPTNVDGQQFARWLRRWL